MFTRRFPLLIVAIIFIMMNMIAFFHAYKFTHFSNEATTNKTQAPGKLSTTGKIKTLFFGVNNPRPKNIQKPANKYQTVVLQSNKKIECWYQSPSDTDSVKGSIIIFHGYGGEKSSMLDKAEIFDSMRYNTLLVDFMGSGGSEGSTTTIGYKEAQQVKTAYDYLQQKGEKKIYLFGTSMGAVAIMKAVKDYNLQPEGIIIECPFGTLYKTVCARFHNMHAPVFPMAGLLVFWGGIQNGYWAFNHNPENYARKINCPTLLLYGEKDKNVSREEIDRIFTNLSGKKYISTYPMAGHENYLVQYRQEWKKDISSFLSQ